MTPSAPVSGFTPELKPPGACLIRTEDGSVGRAAATNVLPAETAGLQEEEEE